MEVVGLLEVVHDKLVKLDLGDDYFPHSCVLEDAELQLGELWLVRWLTWQCSLAP